MKPDEPGIEARPLDRSVLEDPEDERGPVGPFPSWRALYATVLVYAALLVGVLYVLTLTLDHAAR